MSLSPGVYEFKGGPLDGDVKLVEEPRDYCIYYGGPMRHHKYKKEPESYTYWWVGEQENG